MFSILVAELTPELLGKAEYWKFFQLDRRQKMMAEALHVSRLDVDTSFRGWNRVLRLQWEADDWLSYDSDVRCFPVSIAPDGTETRLECPQMPDEVKIEELAGANIIHGPGLDVLGAWVFHIEAPIMDPRQSIVIFAPTPEHYPRLALGGSWVWSTRR